MTKADLIVSIQKKANLPSKSKAEDVLKSVLDSITEALGRGENLTLSGLGSFKVVERAARVGRNPKTGKEIEIPAAKVAKFSPAKALKDALK